MVFDDSTKPPRPTSSPVPLPDHANPPDQHPTVFAVRIDAQEFATGLIDDRNRADDCHLAIHFLFRHGRQQRDQLCGSQSSVQWSRRIQRGSRGYVDVCRQLGGCNLLVGGDA